ncbi:hypothetical protein V6N12_029417 [Hibiscus sabdariffa]|uniref:Uncharacterized protein n=1 Tax=Hibiscus sabdariffa TaxID=183260 RepID=A0ABR2CW36_9ROSI
MSWQKRAFVSHQYNMSDTFYTLSPQRLSGNLHCSCGLDRKASIAPVARTGRRYATLSEHTESDSMRSVAMGCHIMDYGRVSINGCGPFV